MVMWQIWLIVAGFCFILEIITIGFLVFWFAIAAIITSIFSIFINNIVAQFSIFVITSFILILMTRKFANRITANDKTTTNVNSIIGKEATVVKEIETNKCGQVKVNGELWSAVSYENSIIPVNTKVNIKKVDGVKLIVSPM